MSANQVICGNIGTVYDGDDETEAKRVFDEYVRQSKTESGRAGGEDVTWMRNDDPHEEFFGSLSLTMSEEIDIISDRAPTA